MRRYFSNAEGRRAGPAGGFTLVEAVVAFAVLVIGVAGCLSGMVQMNRAAFAARLQTTAVALAQQKIEEVLSAPWTLGSRPSVLSPSVDAEPTKPGLTARESDLPLNNDASLSATGLKSAFTDLDLRVSATRDTTIEDVSTRQVRAVVEVYYTYRGKNYRVSLSTLRSSDYL